MDSPAAALVSRCADEAASSIEAALLEAYERFAPGLLRFARACTHKPGAAEESVQQAFLDLLTAWRMGEETGPPREWLFRSVRQQLDAAGRRCEQARAMAEGYERETPASAIPDLDAPMRRAEVRRRLARVSSPREFEILQLRVEGFSYEEIAAILEIHPGTVASTLARALRKVRQAFREDFL
jgi:RNA polymerase sigma-70 factor, ECF subfamily